MLETYFLISIIVFMLFTYDAAKFNERYTGNTWDGPFHFDVFVTLSLFWPFILVLSMWFGIYYLFYDEE